MSTPAWTLLATVAVGGAAAVWDLRTERIPNLLSLAGLLAGLLVHLALGGARGAMLAALGAAVFALPFVLPWWLGGLGGGDVKLALALGSIVAWPVALAALIFGGVAMAVWSLAVGSLRWLRAGRPASTADRRQRTAASSLWQMRVPQAPALVLGALLALWAAGRS